MDDRLQDSARTWSGVVRTLGANAVLCLAHSQQATVGGTQFEDEKMLAFYDVKKVYMETTVSWELQWQPSSLAVPIPDGIKNMMEVKGACAGMGGIAQGLEAIGFRKNAAMDCNKLMCDTLQRNGYPKVILGDVLVDTDRALLHLNPYPTRCMLASGFHCQPLSKQRGQRGQADSKSKPFHAVLKMPWEQQSSAILLENVKGAHDAGYIQDGIQRLAWSLNMDFVQTILTLDRTWPCRRTRWWWILMKPVEYRIHAIPDLPEDQLLRQIGAELAFLEPR